MLRGNGTTYCIYQRIRVRFHHRQHYWNTLQEVPLRSFLVAASHPVRPRPDPSLSLASAQGKIHSACQSEHRDVNLAIIVNAPLILCFYVPQLVTGKLGIATVSQGGAWAFDSDRSTRGTS
jgi:hypothetical protein